MNELIPQTVDIVVYAAGLVFKIWPLLLLSPLQSPKIRKGRLLPAILTMWVVTAVLRCASLFSTKPLPSLLIPEPLSTSLFLLCGAVLFVFYIVWTRRQQYLFATRTGSVHRPEDLFDLSPTEFEDMVVMMYQAAGHRAKRTGTVGDHGIDVLVKAKNGERWVVQCKRWRSTVGEPVIRDFYGAMQHMEADRGIVIAVGGFTRPARAWVRGKPILLYDGASFLKHWHQTQQIKNRSDADIPPAQTE